MPKHGPQPELKCKMCGRYFKMWRQDLSSIDGSPRPARSLSIHYIDKLGHFCKLRCAAKYGTAVADAIITRGHLKSG